MQLTLKYNAYPGHQKPCLASPTPPMQDAPTHIK